MTTFQELGIQEALLHKLKTQKIVTPTAIQEQTLPFILQGKNLIAQSATGTGKTLAYILGILQHITPGEGIQALIITPTRELAEQVTNEFLKIKPENIHITSAYGGVAVNAQQRLLKTTDIVIGTPGRILDHMKHKKINLSNVQILVLDEADKMLNMGFQKDIEKIMKASNAAQTLLFSATIPNDIRALAEEYLTNTEYITTGETINASFLPQVYYTIPSEQKISLLVHLLTHEHSNLSIVFCNTQASVDFVTKHLQRQKLNAIALHGGMSQGKRNELMNYFRHQKTTILVCTDIGARGLDILEITHVYNYDIPAEYDQYTHRIGRTARAGRKGIAINIVTKKDEHSFQQLLAQHRIEKRKTPTLKTIIIRKGAIAALKPGAFK